MPRPAPPAALTQDGRAALSARVTPAAPRAGARDSGYPGNRRRFPRPPHLPRLRRAASGRKRRRRRGAKRPLPSLRSRGQVRESPGRETLPLLPCTAPPRPRAPRPGLPPPPPPFCTKRAPLSTTVVPRNTVLPSPSGVLLPPSALPQHPAPGNIAATRTRGGRKEETGQNCQHSVTGVGVGVWGMDTAQSTGVGG